MRTRQNNISTPPSFEHCGIGHNTHVFKYLKQGGGFGTGGIKRAVITAVENIQPTGRQRVINRPHEIHARKFRRSFIYREYIANNHIARCWRKRASDGACIAHPNFYARRLRNIEPVTHIFGQLGIKLHNGIA